MLLYRDNPDHHLVWAEQTAAGVNERASDTCTKLVLVCDTGGNMWLAGSCLQHSLCNSETSDIYTARYWKPRVFFKKKVCVCVLGTLRYEVNMLCVLTWKFKIIVKQSSHAQLTTVFQPTSWMAWASSPLSRASGDISEFSVIDNRISCRVLFKILFSNNRFYENCKIPLVLAVQLILLAKHLGRIQFV